MLNYLARGNLFGNYLSQPLKSFFNNEKKIFFTNINKGFFKTNTNFRFSKLNINNNTNNEITTQSNVLINYSKFNMRSNKSKRKLRMPDTKYKMKSHHALAKRVRIVGPLFDKGFKHWANNHSHKMINKSLANLAKKALPRYMAYGDARHAKRMLPYFKRKKYRH